MLTADARIAAIAANQFGIVSRRQLLAAGMTARMIDGRVSKGLLDPVHSGVYAFSSVPLSWRSWLLAAQFCLGDHAFMSHRAAALYWGLDGIEREFVEFTLNGSQRSTPAGVVLHCSQSLMRCDVRFLTPFRLTKVERTLVDLGSVLRPERVEEALESALHHRLTTFGRVKERLEDLRRPGLRGAAALGQIIASRDPALLPTESIFETRFYRMLKKSRRIPPPARQHRIFDQFGFVARLDLAWPPARVGVECHSLKWHGPSRTKHDARRHNRLTRLGWQVLYELYEDMNERPEDVLARLEDLLLPRLFGR